MWAQLVYNSDPYNNSIPQKERKSEMNRCAVQIQSLIYHHHYVCVVIPDVFV